MARAIRKTNKQPTPKAARAQNDSVLRTKQFQRAAILLQRICNSTRIQVISLFS
jgi:hypothetical protein